jgi:hypothetical protein
VKQSSQTVHHQEKRNRNLMSYSNSKLDLLLQYVTLSTDNSVIATCFSKKLLLSGTEILFDKGIYEDILFLAKAILKVKKVEFLDQEPVFIMTAGKALEYLRDEYTALEKLDLRPDYNRIVNFVK